MRERIALRARERLAFPLAAVAAVALAFVLRPAGGPPGVAELARVEPARWDPASAGEAAALSPSFTEAMRRYRAADWAGAAAGLSDALADAEPAHEVEIRFWLGMCRLLEDRPAAALPHLEAAAAPDPAATPGPAAAPDPATAARADWYRAQALLRLEDVDAARHLLDDLSRESPAYARSAAEQLLALRGR